MKLCEIKEEGNALYKEKKNYESLEKYDEAIQLGKGFKEIKESPFYKRFATMSNRIAVYKILTILGANASQTGLNLKNYSKALTFGVKAFKRLKEVRGIVTEEEYRNTFEALEKKIIYRITEAKNNLLPLFHLVRYSDQPVTGVQIGTVIKASDNISGDIFCRSKVLLYEYERGGVIDFWYKKNQGVQGVIINKKVTLRGNQEIRLGGPCEMTRKISLHNIAGVFFCFI